MLSTGVPYTVCRLLQYLAGVKGDTIHSISVQSDAMDSPALDCGAFYRANLRNSDVYVCHFCAVVTVAEGREYLVSFSILAQGAHRVIEVESENPRIGYKASARAPARVINMLRLHVWDFLTNYLAKE